MDAKSIKKYTTKNLNQKKCVAMFLGFSPTFVATQLHASFDTGLLEDLEPKGEWWEGDGVAGLQLREGGVVNQLQQGHLSERESVWESPVWERLQQCRTYQATYETVSQSQVKDDKVLRCASNPQHSWSEVLLQF